MRILLLLCVLLMLPKAFAGNTLRLDHPAAFGPGRFKYHFTENPTVIFDKDIERHVRTRVMTYLNDNLQDIQLKAMTSRRDYDHAIDLVNTWQAPNTFFVHLGRGWANGGFSANLRSYPDNGGTCLVKLEKSVWQGLSFDNKAHILEHELMHCLRWGHGFITNKLNHFDNREVLLRLYDQRNIKGACHVAINKRPEQRVDFIHRKRRSQYSVATKDNHIKLFPGRYRIKVDGETYEKEFRCRGQAQKSFDITHL